jgi:hypothetical protein
MFKVMEVTHIKSSLSPFKVAKDYIVEYPENVKVALGEIVEEYNKVFDQIVPLNMEWPEDYQFARLSNYYFNFAVQIDMKGLEDEFMEWSKNASIDEVKENLRRKICEIENSIAMYQMLARLFDPSGKSHFGKGWREALEEIRMKTNKRIVLLAVTEEKYLAMLASEFGGNVGKKEIYELSGFDDFWGPEEFLKNKEREDVIYFVRSSQPPSWQRDPRTQVEHPLLSSSQLRRIIKAKSITFNIDNPVWYDLNDLHYYPKIINDTKEYLVRMGLGFLVNSYEDLVKEKKLTENFEKFLLRNKIDPEEVRGGEKLIRVKPLKLCYGGYGHLRYRVLDKEFRQKLKRELSLRGPYICQVEMEMPKLKDDEGREYAYIDRIFYAYLNENPVFIGGFRNLMPIDTLEFKKGRIHGNAEAVWAQII